MSLTPKEEAIHLEVKALKEFKPSNMDQESKYIYNKACEEFFDAWTKDILDMLDEHLTGKAKI
jgi:hypothetical protein